MIPVRTLALVLPTFVLAVSVSAAPPARTPKPAPSPAAETIAILDGQPVTVADLEQIGGNQLTQLRNQEYTLKRQIMDEVIARRLVAKEATARGISEEDLSRQEIEAKVPPVPEAEQKQFYEANKSRFGNKPEAEALQEIAVGLRGQRMRERRQQFAAELRNKASLKVLLDAPRMKVEVGDDPFKGPANAPVTIVEFSDFQCPFCSRVVPTLKNLETRYKDKIRIVFRDLPLVQIHPNAAKAAEAGSCANDQGKFWPMHDKMFDNQATLDVESLKKKAVELGLDAAAFNQCLDAGKHSAEWQQDAQDAERYGVTSTPAFFINGRMVVGAVPEDQFAKVIDEELERAGRPAAPAPKANN
jgi:protein-disulfide isomerase